MAPDEFVEIKLHASLVPSAVELSTIKEAEECHNRLDKLARLATACSAGATGEQGRLFNLLVLDFYFQKYVANKRNNARFQGWLGHEFGVPQSTASRWERVLEAWKNCGYLVKSMKFWETLQQHVSTIHSTTGRPKSEVYALCKARASLMEATTVSELKQQLAMALGHTIDQVPPGQPAQSQPLGQKPMALGNSTAHNRMPMLSSKPGTGAQVVHPFSKAAARSLLDLSHRPVQAPGTAGGDEISRDLMLAMDLAAEGGLQPAREQVCTGSIA